MLSDSAFLLYGTSSIKVKLFSKAYIYDRETTTRE